MKRSSLSMIRGPEQVESWRDNFPELEGRRELIWQLTKPGRRAKSFRHALFSKMDRLYQIPFIPDDSTALHCLRLAHQDAKRDLLDYWEGRVPNAAMCQAVSCLKDRFKAMHSEVMERKKAGQEKGHRAS